MNPVVALMSELHSLDIRISVQKDQLVCNGPKNALTPDLRQRLAAHKPELIQFLTSAGVEENSTVPPSHEESDEWQLSRAQKQIWFLDQLYPGSATYNVASALRLSGKLHRDALERSLGELLSRHKALRSTFKSREGQPFVRIGPVDRAPLLYSDFRALPESEREALASAATEARKPFDLEHGPVLRAFLFQTADDEHLLLLTMHHIVSDGWSLGVFARELGILYDAFSVQKPSPLPPPEYQYNDFVRWETEVAEAAAEDQISWWRKTLSGALPILELPADGPRPARQSFRGRRISTLIPLPLVHELQELARAQRSTVFMLLLAAFKVLLSRYTRETDIIVGTATSYRTQNEFANLIGFFVNDLVLRTDVSGDPPFTELLARVRQTSLEAYAHQNVRFDRLVEVLQPKRDLSHTPLFQVMFVLQNVPLEDIQLSELTLSSVDIELEAAHYELSVEIWPRPQGYRCDFEFATTIFEESTIRRMQAHFLNLLGGIARDPASRISALPMLSEEERREIVLEWNNTQADTPFTSVHALFEAQVERAPDALAIVSGERRLTYRELDSMANRLASKLRAAGVTLETPVGVCLERSPECIAAFLAILKVGGAYVPLDASYPPARLTFMSEDSGVRTIIVTRELIPHIASSPNIVLFCLDDVQCEDDSLPPAGSTAVNPDNLAYIMYTSGSTGTPKGVEITHRGIIRLVFGVDYAHFGSDEVFLHMAPVSFDASTLEIWGSLLHGGTCVIQTQRVPSYTELEQVIHDNGVTTLWLTASIFNSVIDEAAHILSSIRQLVTGGEALSVPHIVRALSVLPKTRIINGYGPTESTTFACCYTVPRTAASFLTSIPIGRPIGNTRTYVLDGNMSPVPAGVPGELFIGGDGLARGYRNRPELTDEKFVADKFSNAPGQRLYRTGDLVRYLADGNIEFLGRLDDQVKLRGHRIELGEVETALASQPGVRAAAATVRKMGHGDERLLVWYVASNGALNNEVLREALRKVLPPYMIPYAVVAADALPLSPNGKIDRRSLAAFPLPESRAKALDPGHSGNGRQAKRIAEIMAGLLKREHIELTDDFFSLGGHSLLAIQFAAKLEVEFARQIPPATLFQASTPLELAQVLTNFYVSVKCIVPIRSSGSLVPLFFLHGLDGEVLFYRQLIAHLPADLPVYGIRAAGLDQNPSSCDSMESIAEYYIREMQLVQPAGPYRLCGFSFGGLMAFEMARQLRAASQEVSFLGILDASTFGLKIDWTLRERFAHVSTRLKYRYRFLRKSSKRTLVTYAHQRVKIVRQRISPWRRKQVHTKVAPWIAPERKHIALLLQGAAMQYRPQPYCGKATLFRSLDRSESIEFDAKNGWEKLVRGGVEVYEFDGDHVTFIKEPYAYKVAARIFEALEHSAPQT